MFECELIVGSGSSAVSLDLYDDLPLSLNLNIADIKEPEKRNGDYTKTIKLKGTAINNKFFEETYDVNIVTNTWNPNLKTPAYFLKQGTKPMVGDLRLMSIDVIRKNEFEDITYNVVLMGRNTNIFTTIGDAKLEDLDLSIYDHPFTYAKQVAAETNTIDVSGVPTLVANGVGYRYPLVDYGYNGWSSNYYHVDHLRPAIFVKTYWDKIFSVAGKTYTSTFLNDANDLFCKELILHNGDALKMSAANQAVREFYAGISGSPTVNSLTLYPNGPSTLWNTTNTPSPYAWYTTNVADELCRFNDDSTGSFVDTGNMYNTTTGVFVVQDVSYFQVLGKIDGQVKVTVPSGTTTIQGGSASLPLAGKVRLVYQLPSTSTWLIAEDYDMSIVLATDITTSYQTFTHNLAFAPKTFPVGTSCKVEFMPVKTGGVKFNGGSGTGSIEWKLASTAVLNVKLVSPNIVEGMTFSINDAIPLDIKQKDFLLSVIKQFNLYIDEDKANPNNYIIEPRDNFYALGTTLDWSSKYAADKETHIEPMGSLNVKNFFWQYKQDQDYFNKQYQDSYQEAYGTKKYVVTNDFTKGDNKNEVIFSPTPIVDNTVNDLIIPKIFQWDGTTVTRMKHNIRTVLWNGSVTLPTPLSWKYGTITGASSSPWILKSTYAACGMADSPLASTRSIEFGVPNELFYTGISLAYTTNNLYARFYAKQIQEITDRDSKIVTMYLYLEPQDISKFDFKNKVYIDKTYYYVNKIIDYNPLKNQLTKVELIKVKLGTDYAEVVSVPITDLIGNSGSSGIIASRSGTEGASSSRFGTSNNVIIGDNIVSRTEGAIIGAGRNISIGSSCYLITVISSETISIADSVSGTTLRNSSGITVGASANRIDLTNCNNVNIDELVYNFVGVGLNNVTITTADNGTSRDDLTPSGTITSGTYTPTLTNASNLDGSTAYLCQYLRVGNSVTVSGKVDVDPTAPGASTTLAISLPIASNFGSTGDCGGTASSSTISGIAAAIRADNTNDVAKLQFIATDVTNSTLWFSFTYRII